jgi:hypothetical protein
MRKWFLQSENHWTRVTEHVTIMVLVYASNCHDQFDV